MADLATRRLDGRTAPGARSIFGDALGWDPFSALAANATGAGIDVARTEQGYAIEIPVAGFAPEQVSVTLEDDVLTVEARGEKRQIRRAIVMPEDVDSENVAAKVEHGMLYIKLSLHPKRQPRRIEINAG